MEEPDALKKLQEIAKSYGVTLPDSFDEDDSQQIPTKKSLHPWENYRDIYFQNYLHDFHSMASDELINERIDYNRVCDLLDDHQDEFETDLFSDCLKKRYPTIVGNIGLIRQVQISLFGDGEEEDDSFEINISLREELSDEDLDKFPKLFLDMILLKIEPLGVEGRYERCTGELNATGIGFDLFCDDFRESYVQILNRRTVTIDGFDSCSSNEIIALLEKMTGLEAMTIYQQHQQ